MGLHGAAWGYMGLHGAASNCKFGGWPRKISRDRSWSCRVPLQWWLQPWSRAPPPPPQPAGPPHPPATSKG
eukprot:274293-Chlamydomonas_euryale.AAC.1